MTEKEFNELTKVFVEMLGTKMGNAGCNDVNEDEYPKSICERFDYDLYVLRAWHKELKTRLKGIRLC